MKTQQLLGTIVLMASMTWAQCALAAKIDEPIADLLSELDQIMDNEAQHVERKEAKITALRNRLSAIRNDEDRYWVNSMFYDEYSNYNLDSAQVFVDRNTEIAQRLGRSTWMSECKIRKSYLLAVSGRVVEAEEELKGIDTQKLPQTTRIEYYNQQMFVFSHYLYNSGDAWKSLQGYHEDLMTLYRDSAYHATTPRTPDHLWFKAWYFNGLDADSSRAVIGEINEALRSARFESRADAMLAYAQAQLYRDNVSTECEELERMLILSAMADVRLQNNDIASVEYLSQVRFRQGDIVRGFNYMNYYLRHSQMFHNRTRIIEIGNSHERMRRAFVEDYDQTRSALTLSRILIGVLLGLVVTLGMILKRLRNKLRDRDRDVDSMREEILTARKDERRSRELLDLASQKLKDLKEKFGVK